MENCRLNLLSDVSDSYLHIKTVHFCMNANIFSGHSTHMNFLSLQLHCLRQWQKDLFQTTLQCFEKVKLTSGPNT